MTAFQSAIGAGVTAAMRVAAPLGTWGALAVVAVPCAALLLWLFKIGTPQRLVRRRKDRAIARTLELVLFRTEPLVAFGAFGRSLAADAVYSATLLPGLCLTAIPFLLLLAHLSPWFGVRPLQPGDRTVLTVSLVPGVLVEEADVGVETSPALRVDSPAVRIPEANAICWRLAATRPAEDAWAAVRVNGTRCRKRIALGNRLQRSVPARIRAGLWRELQHPGEPPLPPGQPVSAVRVSYPARTFLSESRPGEWQWVCVFVGMTLVAGAVLKPLLRVEL